MKAISTVGSGLHGKTAVFDTHCIIAKNLHVFPLTSTKIKLLFVYMDHKRDHKEPEFVLQPEFGAGQDALGLLICHPDQGLLVD